MAATCCAAVVVVVVVFAAFDKLPAAPKKRKRNKISLATPTTTADLLAVLSSLAPAARHPRKALKFILKMYFQKQNTRGGRAQQRRSKRAQQRKSKRARQREREQHGRSPPFL